jgi:hypothetical protein
MSDLLDIFQQRHQEKLGQLELGEIDEAFLDEIHALIADLRQVGTAVASPAERGQLRALMHFWGNVVYDRTGVYPDTMLQPLDPTKAPSPEGPSRRPPPSLAWMLASGVAVVIIAVGLVAIGWMSSSRGSATPLPTSTATPVPFLSHVAVGTELGAGDALKMAADTFCLGTSQIIAEFALEGVEPEAVWRWEVQRGGDVVAAQPAAPWGEEAQRVAVRALAGGPEGVEPGQYKLLVYVGEQVVGALSFQVLDTAPRVFDPRVTDVPVPAERASDGSGRNEFGSGVRVIYLIYEYEGLCPGQDVSHTLCQEGEPIQESAGPWGGAPQGQTQVSFQAPGDAPFSPGDYEVAVAIAGEEQARVGLTIGGKASEGASPAFGGVATALGVRPDGTPILTALDNQFDWNTKMIYAIFDYVGMGDGLRWAAVWMRNGQEVAREEHLWDVESDGTEGTRWVTYHDESGRTLPGGSYSVTLSIENVVQHTADLNIRYYVPPE